MNDKLIKTGFAIISFALILYGLSLRTDTYDQYEEIEDSEEIGI
jgi:hypothetical protein